MLETLTLAVTPLIVYNELYDGPFSMFTRIVMRSFGFQGVLSSCSWLLITLTPVVISSSIPSVYGESVGSPADILERGQWVMGLGGGGWWHRTMRGGARVSVFGGEHFRGYGLTNRLSLYGRIGAVDLQVQDSAFSSNPGSSNGFGANLLASAQLKAILWQNTRRDWDWDGSAQYLFIGAPHKRSGNQANWNEWQFATTLAKSFGRFKPYAGIKLSLLSFEYTQHGQTTQHGTYKPDGIVGPVVGMDWTVGEDRNTVLNLEGSYIHGADLNLALTRKF